MEVLLSQSVSGMAASRRRRGGGRAGVRGGRDLAQHADVGLRLCSTQDQSASGARPGSTSGPSLQVASIPSRSPICARGSIFLRGGSSDAYGLLPCAGGAADAAAVDDDAEAAGGAGEATDDDDDAETAVGAGATTDDYVLAL